METTSRLTQMLAVFLVALYLRNGDDQEMGWRNEQGRENRKGQGPILAIGCTETR